MKDFSEQLKNRLSPNFEAIEETSFASVALVLLKAQEQGPGLVLIERAHHPHDPWSGQMGLPGGRCDQGELPHETALRECYEELGLEVQNALGRLPKVAAVGRGRFQDFYIHPHLFTVEKSWEQILPQMRPDPKEVETFSFVSFEQLLDQERHGFFQYEDERFLGLDLPYFECEGKKVWGLTYHILGEFFKNAQGLKYRTSHDRLCQIDAGFWGRFPKL